MFQISCCALIGIMTLTCTPTPKSPLQDILHFLLRIYPFFISFKEPYTPNVIMSIYYNIRIKYLMGFKIIPRLI